MSDFAYIDDIRRNEGMTRCAEAFRGIYNSGRRRAVAILADPDMNFPCLFALHGDIQAHNLYRYLNWWCVTALGITEQILNPDSNKADYLTRKKDSTYSTLRWMLDTGHTEETEDDSYEQVMDITASVLINLYKDEDAAKAAAHMIFSRNKKGRNIHDLVWALFSLRKPEALKLMAERLNSPDSADVALAKNLLNIDDETGEDSANLYGKFNNWFEENAPFLYFTEESMQYSSKPSFCKVDLESKYVQRPINAEQRLAENYGDEEAIPTGFSALPEEDKKLLADYSHRMRQKDEESWRRWLKLTVPEQLFYAKGGVRLV